MLTSDVRYLFSAFSFELCVGSLVFFETLADRRPTCDAAPPKAKPQMHRVDAGLEQRLGQPQSLRAAAACSAVPPCTSPKAATILRSPERAARSRLEPLSAEASPSAPIIARISRGFVKRYRAPRSAPAPLSSAMTRGSTWLGLGLGLGLRLG